MISTTSGLMLMLAPLILPLQDTVRVSAALHVGEVDGPDEYVLGYVSGLSGDAEGNVYVTDSRLTRVQVYDSLGQFTQTMGRRGRGPGEMQRPLGGTALGGGWVGVADLGLPAYLWFAGDGTPLHRERLVSTPFAPETLRTDWNGGIVDSRRSPGGDENSFAVLRLRLQADQAGWRVETDSLWVPTTTAGTRVDLTIPEKNRNLGSVSMPFAPETVWTAFEYGVAYSPDGSYEIYFSNFSEKEAELLLKHDAPNRRIPDVLRERFLRAQVAELEDLAERARTDASRWIDDLYVPERFPGVLKLLTDHFGRLWVLRGGTRGLLEFDVWSDGGTYVGTMQLETDAWPNIDFVTVSGTHVLALFTVEFGVHQIRAFSIPQRLRGQ